MRGNERLVGRSFDGRRTESTPCEEIDAVRRRWSADVADPERAMPPGRMPPMVRRAGAHPERTATVDEA
jgi:hypothetical protein